MLKQNIFVTPFFSLLGKSFLMIQTTTTKKKISSRIHESSSSGSKRKKKWKRLPAGEFEKIILKKPTHGPPGFSFSFVFIPLFSFVLSFRGRKKKKVGKIVFRATTNNSIGFVFSLFRVSVRGCCCYSTLFKLKFKILCFLY